MPHVDGDNGLGCPTTMIGHEQSSGIQDGLDGPGQITFQEIAYPPHPTTACVFPGLASMVYICGKNPTVTTDSGVTHGRYSRSLSMQSCCSAWHALYCAGSYLFSLSCPRTSQVRGALKGSSHTLWLVPKLMFATYLHGWHRVSAGSSQDITERHVARSDSSDRRIGRLTKRRFGRILGGKGVPAHESSLLFPFLLQ